MTTLTIVADDKTITKDNVGLGGFDMSKWLPNDVWAVQWDGKEGHVEKRDGSIETLSTLGIYQQAITDFDEAWGVSQPYLDTLKIHDAEATLRIDRTNLLKDSDWTQMPDSPLSDAKKAEWATYRQALRDLPANTSDPEKPTYPKKPS